MCTSQRFEYQRICLKILKTMFAEKVLRMNHNRRSMYVSHMKSRAAFFQYWRKNRRTPAKRWSSVRFHSTIVIGTGLYTYAEASQLRGKSIKIDRKWLNVDACASVKSPEGPRLRRPLLLHPPEASPSGYSRSHRACSAVGAKGAARSSSSSR